jgi:hypothetical protein
MEATRRPFVQGASGPRRHRAPAGANADRVRCECRFQSEGRDSAWQPVTVRREVGGVFVYVHVPDYAEMVQIRSAGPPTCESAYTPLWMSVRLDPAA